MFAAYVRGHGQALANGGRYDNVGAVFGRARPATGFATDLKALLDLLPDAGAGSGAISVPNRHDPALMARVNELREAGEIGRPLTVYGRGKCDHRGGGEDLIVLGTHILDLQIFFFGAPEYVYADITEDGRPIVKTVRTETVEPIGPAAGDSIFAQFRFPGDVRGFFESRRGLYDRPSGRTHMGITVVGTEGVLSLRFDDYDTRRPRISRGPGALEYGRCFEDVALTEDRNIPGAEPLDYSLCGQPDIPSATFFLEANRFAAWDLIRAIEEDRRPVSSAYNARLTQEMIQGIYAAHLSGGRVGFPLEDRAHPLGE